MLTNANSSHVNTITDSSHELNTVNVIVGSSHVHSNIKSNSVNFIVDSGHVHTEYQIKHCKGY